jgi:hypothetical protein
LLRFAFWAPVSFLFQYAIGWLVPAFVIYFFLEIRPAHRDRAALYRMVGLAIAVGVLLIAPLFVYKAVRFGDPFHSGVIQFGLLGPHWFGVPYYAVNYFAFFGIPVAAMIAYGFFKGLTDRGVSVLVYLCLFSCAIFWIFFYRWLDVRFLLYFVPFAGYLLAKGIDALDLVSLLSWRSQPLPRTLFAYGVVGLSFLYGPHDRGMPFVSTTLPLTPQTVLVFSSEPITKWGGNITIGIDKLHIENLDRGLPAFSFLFHYYPRHRTAVPPEAVQELRELEDVDAAASARLGPLYSVASCGSLPQDYFSAKKREVELRRQLRSCTDASDARLYSAGDPAPAGDVIYSGKSYRLVASRR